MLKLSLTKLTVRYHYGRRRWRFEDMTLMMLIEVLFFILRANKFYTLQLWHLEYCISTNSAIKRKFIKIVNKKYFEHLRWLFGNFPT